MNSLTKYLNPEETDRSCLIEQVDDVLSELMARYLEDEQPIEVDFRKLVSWIPYSDSETHYIHPYPAKLIKHIPIFFLNSGILVKKPGEVVLDPFCGSGTVLLESVLHGFNSVGCDSNPLARLISTVKTTSLHEGTVLQSLEDIVKTYKATRVKKTPNVVNIDHWYQPHIKSSLNRIRHSIESSDLDENIENFFYVCLSSISKKLSNADPRLSVPVKLNPEKYKNDDRREVAYKHLDKVTNTDPLESFIKNVKDNLQRVSLFNKRTGKGKVEKIGNNANSVPVPDCSVDLIITSPPYSGAQKYIRSSSLSLGWLGYCEETTLRDFERKNIGREHYSKSEYKSLTRTGVDEADQFLERIWTDNPLRAHINANYLAEMRQCLKEMYRVLKVDKFCIIVIANNEVCGKLFETQKYVNEIAEQCGFKTQLRLVDYIHSRGLMTKRNKTAGVINSEWILVLRK